MDKQPQVFVAFYKARGDWTDRLIRLVTRAKYSHCEIAIVDPLTASNVYVCYSSSMRDDGVRVKRMALKSTHWDLVPIQPNNPNNWQSDVETIRRAFAPTCGARYDWFGVFSFVLPFLRHARGKWFCSELCAMLLDIPKPHKHTPQSLYNTLKG